MDRKVKRKIVQAGYALLIQRERMVGKGSVRETKFRREGHLFQSRFEAEDYAIRSFPGFPFRVEKIRMNATPVEYSPAESALPHTPGRQAPRK